MAVGSSNSFDLVVLGAGNGGYAAAFRGAQLGLKVALVEQDKIGGTCLHRGCIPTKALIESAELFARLAKATEFGLVLGGEVAVDYAQMARRRDQVVKRIWTGLKTLVDKNKVTWVQGTGRLEGPTKVRVSLAGQGGLAGEDGKAGKDAKTADGKAASRERLLEATDVVIATGSRVKSLPGLEPDGRRIVTSDDILRSDTLPRSIAVVGAGAVGVEFASMYLDLGSQVTLLEYLPAIVPLEDRDVSRELERSFARRGMKVITKARFDVKAVQVSESDVCLVVGPEGGEAAELRVEQLLVATGRAPNVEGIGLESTRVELERGFVKVDGQMRTRESHVYAVGDVVGGLMLAHTATHEGIIAAQAIAGDPVESIDYARQPRATFARPQVASVGLTEQECEAADRKVKQGRMTFQADAKAVIGGDYEGFVKILADAETDAIVGVHLVGPHVTDLIAEPTLGLTLEATAWEIGAATHPHPTLSEAIGEAALAVDGRAINI